MQGQVATEMGTSTTPVREALRELATEGLLALDPHRGVLVQQCQVSELEEVYRIRMQLEPVAIAAAVEHITPTELAAVERLLDRLERETDLGEWVTLNAAFHSALGEATGLPILTSILQKLRNISTLYIASLLRRYPDRVEPANSEHRALLAAIKDRDVSRAQEIELAHLKHTLELGKEQLTLLRSNRDR